MVAWTDEQFRKTCQDIFSTKEKIKQAREHLATTARETKPEIVRLLDEIKSYKVIQDIEQHYINLKECVHCAVTYTKLNNDLFFEIDRFDVSVNNEIIPSITKIQIVYLVREHAYLEDLHLQIENLIKQIEKLADQFEKMVSLTNNVLSKIREKRGENINAYVSYAFHDNMDEQLSKMVSDVINATHSLVVMEDWLQEGLEDSRKSLLGLIAINGVITEISSLHLN